MEGVLIADLSGRKILSTQFRNATLPLESIQTHSNSEFISATPAQPHLYDDSDDEDTPWASTSKTGGNALIQIVRNGLRFIAPVGHEVDPVLPLVFLNHLHQILEDFIGGPVTEASLKDNFDIVLELLEEMLSNGRPLLSQSSQLRELVIQTSQLDKAAASIGLPVNIPDPGANALLTSSIPWRRPGLKYVSNEIYFDVTEKLSYMLSPSGKVISGSVTGEIACRSRLSGMPDLSLSFTDPSALEDCAFHSCVRYAKWGKDRVVSFVPPDGAFTLMTYVLASPTKSLSHSPTALLPLTLQPNLTLGTTGGTFTVTLTSRAPPSRPLTNLVIRVPIGRGATSVTASVNGGAQLEGGKSGGAGRWDVETEVGEVVWRVDSLVSVDRPAVLTGQFLLSPTSRPSPAVSLSFESPSSGFSGLRIGSLKMTGEQFSIYKGVRLRGEAQVEMRSG